MCTISYACTSVIRVLRGISPPVNYPVCMNKDGAGFASNIVCSYEKRRGHVRRVEYSDGANPMRTYLERSNNSIRTQAHTNNFEKSRGSFGTWDLHFS